jgi:hypothetical protein
MKKGDAATTNQKRFEIERRTDIICSGQSVRTNRLPQPHSRAPDLKDLAVRKDSSCLLQWFCLEIVMAELRTLPRYSAFKKFNLAASNQHEDATEIGTIISLLVSGGLTAGPVLVDVSSAGVTAAFEHC